MSAFRSCLPALLLAVAACAPDAPTESAESSLTGGAAPTIDSAQIGRLFDNAHYILQAGASDADGDLDHLEARVDAGPVRPLDFNLFVGWLLDLGDATTLGLGTHLCRLTAVDTAGHRTNKSLLFQVVPPTTPPVVDYLSARVGSDRADLVAYLEAGAHDVDGDLVRLEIELDGSGTWRLVESWTPPTGSGGSTLEVRGLPRGLHTARARAFDVRGAVSAIAGPVSFRFIDPVAPGCALDRVVIDVNEGGYVAQGTASDLNRNLDHVELRLDGGAWMYRGGLYDPKESQPLSARISYEPIARGPHTVEAKVVDASGLSGTCGPISFTAAAAPTIDAIVGTGGSGTAAVSGEASDLDGNLQRIEVTLDGASQWWTATGTTHWSFTFPDPPPGEHVAFARAVDATGLASDQVWSARFTVTAAACFTAKNSAQIAAGRAHRTGLSWAARAAANGSNDDLGSATSWNDAVSSVKETASGIWAKVASCPN